MKVHRPVLQTVHKAVCCSLEVSKMPLSSPHPAPLEAPWQSSPGACLLHSFPEEFQ